MLAVDQPHARIRLSYSIALETLPPDKRDAMVGLSGVLRKCRAKEASETGLYFSRQPALRPRASFAACGLSQTRSTYLRQGHPVLTLVRPRECLTNYLDDCARFTLPLLLVSEPSVAAVRETYDHDSHHPLPGLHPGFNGGEFLGEEKGTRGSSLPCDTGGSVPAVPGVREANCLTTEMDVRAADVVTRAHQIVPGCTYRKGTCTMSLLSCSGGLVYFPVGGICLDLLRKPRQSRLCILSV